MKQVNLTTPTKWNELSRKQILFVCRLFMARLNAETFKIRVFLKFTGVKALPRKIVSDQVYWFFRKGRTKFKLSQQEFTSFLESVNYLTHDSQLTANRFPWFRMPLKRYFGPSDGGYSIIFGEFVHAEKCLYAFEKTNNWKYLNDLCAVLYRPQKRDYRPMHPEHDGDRRERFNDFVYPKRAWRFRMLSKRKRFAVYLFYSGFRNKLFNEHPNLFSSGTVSSEPVNPVKMLTRIMFDLNMGDVTRNKKIYHMQAWEGVDHLEQLIENLPKKGRKK